MGYTQWVLLSTVQYVKKKKKESLLEFSFLTKFRNLDLYVVSEIH